LKNIDSAICIFAIACVSGIAVTRDGVPPDQSDPILLRDCYVYANETTACAHCNKIPLPQQGELCGNVRCDPPDVYPNNVYKDKVPSPSGGFRFDGDFMTRCHIIYFKCNAGACAENPDKEFDWNGRYPGLQVPCDGPPSKGEL